MSWNQIQTNYCKGKHERSHRNSKLPGTASGSARWEQCDSGPQSGAGSLTGRGEAICKERSICHLIFRGVCISCSLPVIFASLSTAWPSNSMLWGFSSGSAAVKLFVHHMLPHNYPPFFIPVQGNHTLEKHSLLLCLWPACSTKKAVTVTSILPPSTLVLPKVAASARSSLHRHLFTLICAHSSLHTHLYTLVSAHLLLEGLPLHFALRRSGDSCPPYALNHGEKYFWPYNCRKH